MKKIIERCDECGGQDLYQGYDVMLPLTNLHNNTLTLNHYADGSFNTYVFCMDCDTDVGTTTETEEIPDD